MREIWGTWRIRRVVACTLGLALTVGAGALVAQTNGDAEFSRPINWKNDPPLYFSVTGGPANTCGSLEISRNGGAWTSTPGWICTGSSGAATKGPWYWKDQADDETAEAFIRWPNGDRTDTDVHIWDVQRPTVGISGTCFSLNPLPACWQGTASDGIWGACFDSSNWVFVWSSFRHVNAGRYYDFSTGAYDASSELTTDGSFAGLPSCTPAWSGGSTPPASAHQAGHLYEWKVYVYDGGQLSAPATFSFYYDP